MGWLDRFRRTPRRAAVLPLEDQVAIARQAAVDLVSPGFTTRDEASEALVEQVLDDPETYADLDAERAREILADVWDERVAVEATWSDEGDYPALRAAFEDLERSGIVARMSFTCCQTCGHAEIGDEPGAEQARGYTFFHEQDAERLEPGASALYLAFGGFGPDPDLDPDLLARSDDGDPGARQQVIVETEERIAGDVVATLREHGLDVEWDGTVEARILLPSVDWRKRVPTG